MSRLSVSRQQNSLAQRAGISLAFLINGMNVSIWSVMVPVLIESLSIRESEIGVMILIAGLFSAGSLYGSGILVARYGSRLIGFCATLLLAPGLLFLYLAPTYPLAIFALTVLLCAISIMDIAMNANAADYESLWERSAMSSFHGFWSLGALLGAFFGGYGLAYLGPVGLTISVGLMTFCASIVIAFSFIDGGSQPGQNDGAKAGFSFPRQMAVYVLGMIAMLSFVSEGAIYDWAAVFLRRELDVNTAQSGFALSAMASGMVLARFSGDWVNTHIGPMRLLISSGALSALGFGLVGIFEELPAVLFGFFITGLGLANIVPVAFSSAAKLPNLPKGVAISFVTMCGYSGLLVAPALLGWVGEITGFGPIFLSFAVPLLLLVPVALLLRKQSVI